MVLDKEIELNFKNETVRFRVPFNLIINEEDKNTIIRVFSSTQERLENLIKMTSHRKTYSINNFTHDVLAFHYIIRTLKEYSEEVTDVKLT